MQAAGEDASGIAAASRPNPELAPQIYRWGSGFSRFPLLAGSAGESRQLPDPAGNSCCQPKISFILPRKLREEGVFSTATISESWRMASRCVLFIFFGT